MGPVGRITLDKENRLGLTLKDFDKGTVSTQALNAGYVNAGLSPRFLAVSIAAPLREERQRGKRPGLTEVFWAERDSQKATYTPWHFDVAANVAFVDGRDLI
ncbi:MAG: hypothetical protein R3C68_02095 [Myxococcota bacterium]